MLIFVPKDCVPSWQPTTSDQVSAWGFSPVLLKNVLTLEYLSHANDKTTCQPEEVIQLYKFTNLNICFCPASSTIGNPSGARYTQRAAMARTSRASNWRPKSTTWMELSPNTFFQKPALQCNISHHWWRKLILSKGICLFPARSVSTMFKWFALIC